MSLLMLYICLSIDWTKSEIFYGTLSPYTLAFKFFREVFKPERNLKKDDLLNYLKSKFNFHEQVVKQIVKQYFIEEKMSKKKISHPIAKSLSIYSSYLRQLASMCFEDILTLRIYADTQNNLEVPEISNCTHDPLLTCILKIF